MNPAVKTIAIKTANTTLRISKVVWDMTWATLIVLWDWTWRSLKYIGRVSLWVLVLPLGIFRSWLHHSKKRDERIIAELEKNRMV